MNNDITIATIISHMHPYFRDTFKSMLASKGASEDLPSGEIPKLFPKENDLPRDESLALIAFYGGWSRQNSTKFAPKLDFKQRCEIYALSILGFDREVLAKVYGVDRRTITHICNAKSPHYKNVRVEALSMGENNFINSYATEDVKKIALMHRDQDKTGNNRYASGKMGLHMMRNDMCKYDHRVQILWVEGGTNNVKESGWYYRDLDSEWPDDFFHCGPDSMKTSQACFTAASADISDKLP